MPNLLPNCKTLTMSSREIADLTGKRHDNVMRTIETLQERGAIGLPHFEEVQNPGPGPSTLKQYRVGKRDSYVIVAQLSPEFTAALVDRWQELESANRVQLPDFTNPAESARAWAEQYELRAIAQQALAIAAPKAEFVDRYVVADGSMSFRQVAKLLTANERKFRQMLLDKGVMYYLGGVLTPYQQHIDAGRFEVKTGTSERNQHAFTQARFTPKGVQWVAGLWAAQQMEQRA